MLCRKKGLLTACVLQEREQSFRALIGGNVPTSCWRDS